MSRPEYWFYLDDDQAIQGPFPDKDMLDWYTDGYFTLETKVRAALFEDETCSDPSEFEEIGKRCDFLDQATVTQLQAQRQAELAQKVAQEHSEDTQQDMTRDAEHSEEMNAATHVSTTHESKSPVGDRDTASTEVSTSSNPPISSLLADWTDDDEWYYVDKSGKEQGPFPTITMRTWFMAGHFHEDSLVRPKVSTIHAANGGLGPSGRFAPAKAFKTRPFGELRPNPATATKTAPVADSSQGKLNEDRLWFYQETVTDPSKQQQQHKPSDNRRDGHNPRRRVCGPFSTLQMRYWIRKGFLTYDNVPIRREGQSQFIPILQHPDLKVLLAASPESHRPESGDIPGRTQAEIQAMCASLDMNLPMPVTRFEALPAPLVPLYAMQHMGQARYMQELQNARTIEFYQQHQQQHQHQYHQLHSPYQYQQPYTRSQR